MAPLPEDVNPVTIDSKLVRPTDLTSYSATPTSTTDFSLGGSDIVEIVTLLEEALAMKLTSIPSNDITPVLTNAIASLAQGKTFKNKYVLDTLVKYISENIAQLVNSEASLDLKTKPDTILNGRGTDTVELLSFS